MKRIFILTIIFSGLLASSVSCSKNELDRDGMHVGEESFFLTVNYDGPVRTTLGAEMVPVWNAGDEIWISDGSNTTKAVVPAAYAGKSSAVLEVTGVNPSKTLYAAYPYNEKTVVSGGSITVDIPAVQDGSFASANIVSGICKAGQSSLVLRNATAILEFSFLREDLSSVEICCTDSLICSSSSSIHLDLKAGHGTKYISCRPITLVPGTSFSFVTRDGRFGYIETTSKNILKAGTIYDMGEIDERISLDDNAAVDLGADETANCYIVSSPGNYRIRTCRGNSHESVGDVSLGAVLWETVNKSSVPKRNSLIAETAVDGDYLYFRVKENAPDGNALIAAVGAGGETLWSWHIWLLAGGVNDQTWTDGSSSDAFSGAVMMDRNLGALTATLYTSAYGLMYQWGRKDPFYGSGTYGAGASLLRTYISEETGNIGYATAHPLVMIVGEDGDWLSEPDYSLWSASSKTVYDPCPAGYHVPFMSAFDGITTSNTTWYNSFSNHGSRTVMGSEYVRFPAAGARNYKDGTTFNYESYGYYWCDSKAMRFGSEDILSRNISRGYAVSVRCQKNATGEARTLVVGISTSVPGYVMKAPMLYSDGFPSATIDWGDGSGETPLSVTSWSDHEYSSAGDYYITVTGRSVTGFKIKSLGNVSEIDLSNF